MAKQRAIGERVRLYRQAAGFAIRRLAALAGMPRSSLARLELGQQRAKHDEIVALANALGIPVDRLYRDDEKERKAS